MATADEAMKSLEYEKSRGSAVPDKELVWTIKGWDAIRRKLSEILSTATAKLMIVESYPPDLITAVAASLKSCSRKGVKVTAISLVGPEQTVDERSELVEYRRFRHRRGATADRTEEILESLRGFLHGSYCIALADDSQALISLFDVANQGESLGISAKIPAIPLLQRMLFEELLSRMTVLA